MKQFILPFLVSLLPLAGCAQKQASDTAAASEESQTDKVEELATKGATGAARFVVGKVVGTPAKVAMAAGQVSRKVLQRDSESNDSSGSAQ